MTQSRGTTRERQARKRLEADGWVVVRAAGSLGPVDLVAMRCGHTPRFVQVKSDRDGPYKNFGPAAREELARLAAQAGAEAYLLWWPPRSEPVFSGPHEWPAVRR
jgi:Holliday junction resolvase